MTKVHLACQVQLKHDLVKSKPAGNHLLLREIKEEAERKKHEQDKEKSRDGRSIKCMRNQLSKRTALYVTEKEKQIKGNSLDLDEAVVEDKKIAMMRESQCAASLGGARVRPEKERHKSGKKKKKKTSDTSFTCGSFCWR